MAVDSEDRAAPATDVRDLQSWPALLGHVVMDITRVIEGEMRLARASVGPTLTAVLERWLLQIVLASMALAGLTLLMGASVLLLHKWLEWWLALGVVGAAIVVLSGVGLLLGRG